MAANFHLVQSLIKSLAILEVLCESVEGMGVSEIGERVGLNKSTVHRILTTLVHENYVEQDQAKGRYRLSPKMFELSRKILNNVRPAKVIAPQLEKLAHATGESARYSIIDGTNYRLIVSDEVMTSKPIKVRSHLGQSLPLSQTAAGKMYLASLDDKTIKEVMDQKGRKAVLQDEKTNFATLQKELNTIRDKGFAFEKSTEDGEEICGLAAPVRNEAGEVIAVIDVLAPGFRCPKDAVNRYSEMVMDSALQVSKKLGYIPA
ncbi:MAG: IclR family transcriptional regulator [Candidatus Zixiibacteriota bacterium]|nr:MAG: IclR family transcriptional regulator [candidate division Zixibacteria bacterium]